MQHDVLMISGTRILQCAPDGAPVADERAALDLIADARGQDAAWVALPAARLSEDFFRLKTGLAGAIVQKFVNYQIRLAIIGDITLHLANSEPLRDFVREANRGKQVWFAHDLAEFHNRLAS